MALNLKQKFETNRKAAEEAAQTAPPPERRPNPRASDIAGSETIFELRAKLDEAKDKAIQFIDPRMARPSVFMNRHPSAFETQDFVELVDDIRQAGGNTVPAVVRRLHGDPSHQFEIIAGLRRHEASLRAGTQLKVYVEQLDDKQAFETMTRENANRKDLSPWEWGRHYTTGLRMYATQKELAAANGMSEPHVARSMEVYRLPEEVVAAFPSPRDIQYQWGTALTKALQQGEEKIRRAALDLAKKDPRPSAPEVFRTLMEAVRRGRPATKTGHDTIRKTVHFGKMQGVIWSKGGKCGFEAKVPLSKEKAEALEAFLKTLLTP